MYSFVKGLFDVTMAAIALPFFFVISLFIALAIKIDSQGPIFFKCTRLGKNGRPIKIWKFRTMVDSAEEKFNPDGSRLVEKNDPRITKVGAFLRHGLDELPQLINVICGEVSFIGPRPDDLFAINMYRPRDIVKLSVKPGLSGLAQVSGRNDIPYLERLKYDVYYAENLDVLMDIRIFVRTVFIVFGARVSGDIIDKEIVLSHYEGGVR